MTEPKAWHCPSCNAYHAPHVDTCPKPKPPVNLGGQHSYGQALASAATNPNFVDLLHARQAQNILRSVPNQQ